MDLQDLARTRFDQARTEQQLADTHLCREALESLSSLLFPGPSGTSQRRELAAAASAKRTGPSVVTVEHQGVTFTGRATGTHERDWNWSAATSTASAAPVRCLADLGAILSGEAAPSAG